MKKTGSWGYGYRGLAMTSLFLMCAACAIRADISVADSLVRDDAHCDYLIIIPSGQEFLQQAERLAQSKTRRGLRTVIAVTDSIETYCDGSDLSEKIRDCIIDAHREWHTTWVLLAGDYMLIPTRMLFAPVVAVGTDTMTLLSDFYHMALDQPWDIDNDGILGEEPTRVWDSIICYYDVENTYRCDSIFRFNSGPDTVADIYLGRLPASDAVELEIMITKILDYAQDPLSSASARNVLFMGARIGESVTNPESGLPIDETSCLFHYQLRPFLGGAYSPDFDYSITERYEDSLTDDGIVVNDSLYLTAAEFEEYVTGDNGMVFMAFHGSGNALAISSQSPPVMYTSEQILDLQFSTHALFLPVSCYSALGNNGGMSFAKALLVNPTGGAVGISASTGWEYFNVKKQQYIEAMRLLVVGGITRPGQYLHLGNRNCGRQNKYVFQFWGDPELDSWTRSVTGADTIRISVAAQTESTVTLQTLPDGNGILVCGYHDGGYCERAFTENGRAIIRKPSYNPTSITLTASAHNYLTTSREVEYKDGVIEALLREVSHPYSSGMPDISYKNNALFVGRIPADKEILLEICTLDGRRILLTALRGNGAQKLPLAAGTYAARLKTGRGIICEQRILCVGE